LVLLPVVGPLKKPKKRGRPADPTSKNYQRKVAKAAKEAEARNAEVAEAKARIAKAINKPKK
jgi:hypothetical protein